MATPTQQLILEKKEVLKQSIKAPLAQLGEDCVDAWLYVETLDHVLAKALPDIPNCVRLYAWNITGTIRTSIVHANESFDSSWQGYDISNRPYLKNNLPYKGMMLSSIYTSIYLPGGHEQCLTALQAVNDEHDELLGFVAADFRLEDVLQDTRMAGIDTQWTQYRGDPAVRGTLFMQSRVQSQMDDNIDSALESIYNLFAEQGLFHAEIHFSSGRCAFWFRSQPFHYRMHGVEEIIDPDILLAYSLESYPDDAVVTPAQIEAAFTQLKSLRYIDETIYLRAASLNIMNGMIGLTFSCDGSHFMQVEEFLHKDSSFWMGETGA